MERASRRSHSATLSRSRSSLLILAGLGGVIGLAMAEHDVALSLRARARATEVARDDRSRRRKPHQDPRPAGADRACARRAARRPRSPPYRRPVRRAPRPVAQKVVLYEEDPNDPQGKRFVGSAIWRTERVSPGPNQPAELAIRADVEIPDRKLAMTWSLRRNTDPSLPASHTVEIMFRLPQDFPPAAVPTCPAS